MSFQKQGIELLTQIWAKEGLASIPAQTLKAWVLQNYGAGAFPEIEKAERQVAGERRSPDVQANARRLQRFRHPQASEETTKPVKSAAPPVVQPSQEEQPLSAPPREDKPLQPVIPQPLSTPPQPDVEKVVAPEAPDISITPNDYGSIASLSPAALTKKFERGSIISFLKDKKVKVREGLSHRQAAAQLLAWIERQK